MAATEADLGFSYRASSSGELHISRDGRTVTRMRGSAATRAVARLDALDFAGQQQLLARLTGNYKRGNEKPAKQQG